MTETQTSKFTPGPWTAEQGAGSTHWDISAPSKPHGGIAMVYTSSGDVAANAALIAEAPALYEATRAQAELIDAVQDVIRSYLPADGITQEQAIDEIVELLDCPNERQVAHVARAALARVDGEATA